MSSNDSDTITFNPVILGAIRSTPDLRDRVAENIFPAARNLNLPETLDLRNRLLPIRNQGQQGTCVAQTGACMKEWQESLEIGLDEHLSPQYIYNLRANYPGPGMQGRDLMKILSGHGCCREGLYRYGRIETSDNIPTVAHNDAANFKIKEYAQVKTVDGLKTALYKNGPCYIALPVYNYTDQFWNQGGGNGQEFIGGHAVTVVGYNEEGFILRNSWGIGWGDKGYTIFPYKHFGKQWEIWTSIDAESGKVEPTYKCNCFGFIFY
jgi:C1A family cysteine protease